MYSTTATENATYTFSGPDNPRETKAKNTRKPFYPMIPRKSMKNKEKPKKNKEKPKKNKEK
mgnify:CR=1 FL=1